MTVQELIDSLDKYDPDTEVRLAMQPTWPFEYSIKGVCSSMDVPGEDGEEISTEDETEIVYIAEGSQLAYANKNIFEAAC